MNKKGLGKGLGAIFTDNETIAPVEEVQPHEKEIEIAVSDIIPNPLQPRKIFDADKLAELTESIKEHGVIQPLIVRKNGVKYEIVAGERRWRAAKIAKLKTVPVIVREYDNAKMAEIALVENIQRHVPQGSRLATSAPSTMPAILNPFTMVSPAPVPSRNFPRWRK